MIPLYLPQTNLVRYRVVTSGNAPYPEESIQACLDAMGKLSRVEGNGVNFQVLATDIFGNLQF